MIAGLVAMGHRTAILALAAFEGKAANLGELIRLGAPVPPGFAIGVSEFEAHISRCGLRESLSPLVRTGEWADAEKSALAAITAHPLDPSLASGVLLAARELASFPFTARSSATVEDGAEASFAGQFRTLLDIHGERALLEAIPICWASLWTERVLEYRHRRGADHFSSGMGVVVQAMVPCEFSGVLFTVDPVAHRSDHILIQIAPGLGEAIVSGREAGVVYRVDRESLSVLDSDGEGERLSDVELKTICQWALTVEEHFGCPQDLEFGFLRGEVSIFQTRPMTGLSEGLADPLDPPRKPTWPERMILPMAAEHYTSAPKPLDNLVYTRLVGAAVHGLRAFGGKVSQEDEESFREEIWRQAYRFPRHRLTWRALGAGWKQISLLRKDWVSWWMAGPEAELREISKAVEIGGETDMALFHHTDRILDRWESLLKARMYAAGALRANILLKLLVTLAVGSKDRSRVLAELSGGLDTPTDQVNRALWDLSRIARETPSIRSAVRRRSQEELAAYPEGRTFLGAVAEFLDTYGHREGGSWYLSSPTWARDPDQVWGLLSSLVEAEAPPADPSTARERYRVNRDLVRDRLAAVPLLARLFLWTLGAVRRLTLFREQSHFDLTRPLHALQPIADEWGTRLLQRGVLSDPEDVFFLTAGEVKEWLLEGGRGVGGSPESHLPVGEHPMAIGQSFEDQPRPQPEGAGG